VEHSTDDAGRLTAAFREREDGLEPLREMLATPGDRFTRDREDRAANDAMVVSLVEDLRPLAKHTKRWLRWAAREVTRREREVDDADEASLAAAVAAIAAVREPARELVDEAVAVLDVVQRAALARHMISDLGFADRVWGPHAAEQRANLPSHQTRRADKTVAYTRLDDFVEQQLEHFRAKTSSLIRRELPVPAWLRRDIQWTRVRWGWPLMRRWRSLHQPMQTIQVRGREIDAAHERVTHAHAQVVAARRQAEREAERERRRREKEAEAQRRRDEAERLTACIDDLLERYDAFRDSWRLPSNTLRERGWTELQRVLCNGIYDADEVLVVDGVPREEAHHVLALLALAADCGDETAERLDELLAAEDELLRERSALHEATADLPVREDARSKLARLQPDLRRAHDWLVAHAGQVIPVLAAQAPEAAHALREALHTPRD
jgi:hypothetical protein